jgi:tetratricopeptide (TPR) repeat protein
MTAVVPRRITREERLQQLVNEIDSMLAGKGLPKSCARCGVPCQTVRDLQLGDDFFLLTVPLNVCPRCAVQPPFPQKPLFPMEGNLPSIAASVLEHLVATADRVARVFNRTQAAARDRNRPTLDALVRTIAPYGRVLEAFAQTIVTCDKSGLRETNGPAESQRLRNALSFLQPYSYLNTGDELKQSGLPVPILSGYPEIIDGRIQQAVDQERPDGPLLVQVGAVLLPGRRWEFDCQLFSHSSHASLERLRRRILQSLESLPTWPVAYPVVWAVRRSFARAWVNLHQELQRPFQSWSLRIVWPGDTYARTACRFYGLTLPQQPLSFQAEDFDAIERCLPESAPIKMLHAEFLMACRRHHEALDIWHALAEKFPDDTDVVLRRIACLAQSGQLERAASECHKYILGHRNAANAYASLSELQFALGLHAESLKTIDQALALKEAAEFFQARAGILAEMGRFPEATSAVNTAIFQDRNCAVAYLLRAKIRLHARQHEDAIEDLNQYHRCAGKSVQSLQLQTVAWRALGRTAEAERAYRTVIQESPHNLVFRVELAAFLTQTGRHETARQECNRIIELAPHLRLRTPSVPRQKLK